MVEMPLSAALPARLDWVSQGQHRTSNVERPYFFFLLRLFAFSGGQCFYVNPLGDRKKDVGK
jgi:hypothetical protein